jgi:hypothetical protein
MVKTWAVHGNTSYSHRQSSPVGEQSTFRGKTDIKGSGPEREMIFNSLLYPEEDGHFRMDYQVEIGGEQEGQPPLQAMGQAILTPGEVLLAAKVGAWRYYIQLPGRPSVEVSREEPKYLVTRLKCGGSSYPANFSYIHGEEYTAILFTESTDVPRKFTISLRVGDLVRNGALPIQYSVSLKEDGATMAGSNGSLTLKPGTDKSLSVGNGCTFWAKTLK